MSRERDEVTDFSSAGRRCFYRPRGTATAGQLAHLIADALQRARGQALDEALIDITAASGFESPGPAFRRWAVSLWSHAVGNEVRVALVARAEHICPEKTGLLVAAEEGLRANIFDAEPEALRWLDAAGR